MSTAAKLLSLF